MKHIYKQLENGGKPLEIDIHESNDLFMQSAFSLCDKRVEKLMSQSWQGFLSGHPPTLCESGVGGTYFMNDSCDRMIGVFKPHDEEMGCSNNPKGFTPQDNFLENVIRRGVKQGEAAFRECAAYVLDHANFSNVPATDLVVTNFPVFRSNSPTGFMPEYENVKFGSFQEFKEHDFDAEEISPSKAAMFPVHEVHKIAVLDIRLFNTDRHGGNILVKATEEPQDCPQSPVGMQFKMDFDDLDFEDDDEEESPKHVTSYELIPIDHGYCLPQSLSGLSDSRFEWLNWPQSKVTFGSSALDYINSLNAREDIQTLQERFPDRFGLGSLNVLLIATTWLQVAARNGLTPFETALAMHRPDRDVRSKLETMCDRVKEDMGLEEGIPLEHTPIDEVTEARLVVIMESGAQSIAKTRTSRRAAL